MILLLWLMFLGCVEAIDSSCESVTLEVEDDADLGDIEATVGGLLAGAAGTRTLPATGVAGSRVAVDLEIERGEGKAVFTDTTVVLKRHLAFRDSTLLMRMICDDAVEIPVTYNLTTADGTIALDGATVAVTISESYAGAEPRFTMHDLVDLEEAILPEPPDGVTGVKVSLSLLGHEYSQYLGLEWAGGDAQHDPLVRYPPEESP